MDQSNYTIPSDSCLLQTDARTPSDAAGRGGGRSTRFPRQGGRFRRLMRWAAIPVVAVGMALAADAPRAEAGGFSFSVGSGFPYAFGPSFGYRAGFGAHPFYGNSFRRGHFYRYGTGYRGFHPGLPRVNYRQPCIVPGRSPFGVIPGGRHLHRRFP